MAMQTIPSLICGLSIALAGSAAAALRSSDQFLTDPPFSGRYISGWVEGQNPTVLGYSGAYTGDVNVSVQSAGLSYAGMSTSGGSLRATPYGRAGRELTTAYDGSTEGTFYFGFLLQLGETSNGELPSYSAVELFSADGDRTLQLGSSPGDFGTSTDFGIRINNSGDLRLSLGAADTDVNLFVLRIDLSIESNADTITIYRNPSDLSSEEANAPVGVLAGLDFEFSRISLASYNGNGGSITADEMRIGTEFSDATAPVPEPRTAAMVLFGGAAILLLRRRRVAL